LSVEEQEVEAQQVYFVVVVERERERETVRDFCGVLGLIVDRSFCPF
jgi:hypothetical protein